MTNVIHSPAEAASVPDRQPANVENEASFAQRAATWMKQLGHVALADASNFALGTHFRPEDVDNHISHYATVTKLTGHETKSIVKEWHGVSWRKPEKYSKALAWGNLAFGEGIALGAQGYVQGNHTSSALSFGTGVATALTVELAASIPIAWKNRKHDEPITTDRIARSMGVAFWLGGAWGVEEQKLKPKHMLYPIGAYLVFGAGVAALGEVNDVASHIVDSPAFLPALLALGVTRTVNQIFEYEDGLDRMGNRTGDLIDRQLQRHRQRKMEKEQVKAVKSKRKPA